MGQTRTLAHDILETFPLVMRTVAAELRQHTHNIESAHFRLLWLLEHEPQTLSQLAEKQSVSLPTMSNTVTILEERGWARRQRLRTDRRKVVIEITPDGLAVLDDVRKQAEVRVMAVLSVVAPDDQALIARALAILRDVFADAAPVCDANKFRKER